MANDKNFLIKNGLQAGRYLQTGGTETAGTEGYNLSEAAYDSVSFSVASQDSSPTSIAFNSTGTKMYMLAESVFQYSLSTAYDLSSASYDSVSFSILSQEGSADGMAFSSDGTKMYVVGDQNRSIYQYSLSTAFDLSTASYDSISLSVSSRDISPADLTFNSSGTKMYLLGLTSESVYQYSLSTAFANINTASYDSVSFSVSSESGDPTGLSFSADGTKMFIIDSSDNAVYQYSLSTAFDISTAAYDNISFSVTSQDTTPRDIAFNNDGTKMYMVGDSNNSVYQYSTAVYTQTLDLSTGTYFSFTPSGATTVSFTNAPASGKAVGFAVEINGDGSAITWPSSVKWPSGTAPTATASKEVYAFVTTDGGTTYYGKQGAQGLA